MKNFLTLFLCVAGLNVWACPGAQRSITMEQLPAAARQFVMEHFEGVQTAHIMEDVDRRSKSYEIRFVNGDKIEFAEDGTWTEVDCICSGVPKSVIPMSISEYLSKAYPGVTVRQIEREKRGFGVKLSNGMKIRFNQQLKLVDMDN